MSEVKDANHVDVSQVRACIFTDLAFILSLASERYRHFDAGKTLLWLTAMMQAPTARCARTDHGFCISNIVTSAWHPKEREAHVIFLCCAEGKHWDGVRLLKDSIAWGRGEKCVRWWFCSETEHAIDALAKRVGAVPAVMRYRLDLTE
jgi:hypothetical protein